MDQKEYVEFQYWGEKIEEAKESSRLISDCQEAGYKKDEYNIAIDEEDVKALVHKCNNNKMLQYSYLLTALIVSTSKYMLSPKVTIGIPCYNGGIKGALPTSKIIPITTTVDLQQSYKECFYKINHNLAEHYKNQNSLNQQVLSKSNLSDLMQLTPISIGMKSLHDDRYINYICDSSKNEISFLLEPISDYLMNVKIIYNSNKFSIQYIKSIANSFKLVIKNSLENVNEKINNINILCEEEKHKLLYEFNDTKLDYCRDKMIHELFQEVAIKTPNKIAVVCGEDKITYKELHEKSNQVARVLRSKGVKSDSVVGMMVDRSINMIVSILGILKSGAAYLPIDGIYPAQRIMYMLQEGKVSLLIVENNLISGIEFDGEILDITNYKIYEESTENLSIINKSSDLAYVIFTSGSTGKPKGVMIEHRQVNNFVNGIVRATNLNQYESILCITTVCFDIFGLETLVPLTHGLKIIIANSEEQINDEKLSRLMKKNDVEVMQSTPSRLNVLLENQSFRDIIKKLKLLLIGGEELQQNVIDKIPKVDDLKLINVYGPTETTIWSTSKELKSGHEITIGKPISNTQIYIMNNNELVPIGVAGELCIAGDGVARGYINRPELTSKKFIDNPFGKGKLYKTGDLAKYLCNGDIKCLGRIDNQVKIRGFRIELGEIEKRLLEHKDINQVAVLIKENKSYEKSICAYFVAQKDISDLELKNYIKEKLPEYMVPSYFIKMKEMPLTLNGKLNKKLLPQPQENDLNIGIAYVAARNKIDEQLIKVWGEVLDISTDKISIDDNFFNIGGNSLSAIRINNLLKTYFGYDISLIDFYKDPTVRSSSDKLAKINMDIDVNLVNVKLAERFSKEVSILTYSNENTKINVLYTNDRVDEIIKYLDEEYRGEFLPQYVLNYSEVISQESKNRQVTLDELNSELNLNVVKDNEINNFLNIVDKNITLLKDSIIKSTPINNKLGIMLNEKNSKFERRRKRRIMFFAIEIKSVIDKDSILNSIKNLINDQNVFRMVLSKKGENYYYDEYEKIDNINMEFIDISKFTLESRESIVSKIINYMNEIVSTGEFVNNLFYSINVIKVDRINYGVLISLDHQVSDAETSRIINRYFTMKKEENSLNSKSYIQYINKVFKDDAINKANDFKVSSCFNEFKNGVNEFYSKYPQYLEQPIKLSKPVVIKYNYGDGNDSEKNPFKITLVIALNLIKTMFKTENIPLRIYYNNRNLYNEYYYTIGNFADSIFCNFYANELSYKECGDKYYSLVDDFTKNEIIIKALRIDSEISEIFKQGPFILNYTGIISEKEEKMILSSVKNFKKYSITAYDVLSHISIIFSNGIIKKELQLMLDILNQLTYDYPDVFSGTFEYDYL